MGSILERNLEIVAGETIIKIKREMFPLKTVYTENEAYFVQHVLLLNRQQSICAGY